jgi:hypothetical protein
LGGRSHNPVNRSSRDRNSAAEAAHAEPDEGELLDQLLGVEELPEELDLD